MNIEEPLGIIIAFAVAFVVIGLFVIRVLDKVLVDE